MLNPNCSEVIAKLEVECKEEAIELIENYGFIVIEYDLFAARHGIVIKDEPPDVLIIDPKNPFGIDIEYGSDIKLLFGEYGCGEGWYIRADQHSQHQIYQSIERLERALGLNFSGYDGGGSFDSLYEDWKKRGRPTIKNSYQTNMREELNMIFSNSEIQKITNDTLEVMNYVVSKEDDTKSKITVVKGALKNFSEERREAIIDIEKWKRLDMYTEINEEGIPMDELIKKHNVIFPSDSQLFQEGQEKYINIYGTAVFLAITNEKFRKALLGRKRISAKKTGVKK